MCLCRSNTYFLTSSICGILFHRFRQEAREERLGSGASPAQRVFNIASSSYLMVLILPIGLIFCLPLLLLLPLIKILFGSYENESEVDASILSSPPATKTNKVSSSTRRRGAYMEHRDSINLHATRLDYLSSLNIDE